MADRKISDLTALTTPASGDYVPIVDISEVAAASKNKRITIEELMRGMPDGTAAAPGIAFETDPNTGIYSPGADQLAVATNGTGRLFITSAGLVGIGTSSPVSSTQIETVKSSSTAWAANTIDDICRIYNSNTSTNNASAIYSAYCNYGDGTFTGARFGAISTGSFSAAFVTALRDSDGVFRERLRIDSSGRVGIGTSAPDVNLHVNSTGNTVIKVSSTFADSTTTGFRVDTTGNASIGRIDFLKAGIQRGSVKYVHNATATSELLGFNVAGGTDKLVIDGAGRVGIGTTIPSSLLHLADAGNITVGTTTGTKIGTATTQKIGFYNATPVVQPTAVADATDAASVITQLNALLTRMRNLGLIAT